MILSGAPLANSIEPLTSAVIDPGPLTNVTNLTSRQCFLNKPLASATQGTMLMMSPVHSWMRTVVTREQGGWARTVSAVSAGINATAVARPSLVAAARTVRRSTMVANASFLLTMIFLSEG